MLTRLLFGITLLLAAPALAEEVVPDTPTLTVIEDAEVTLDQFQWTARPIVVFADAKADPRFDEQMRFLEADIPGLLERDVVVLIDTDPRGKSPLRQALRPRGFMLALIDKDGDVKLRKPAPWTVREITRSIDKWPSRQQEIKVDLGKE
ncbi:DUF4174 domain-containing protein [Thalassovita sp.]|jgi:hypothetical protein|uniref:DUF4174 domain-containing protein n=1 Tax=Thalassovita sp. TaxID=1979401 RepID=UPI003B5C0C45